MNKISDLIILKEILIEKIVNDESFDILDYYELTDINYFKLLKILQKNLGLTVDERKILNRFFKNSSTIRTVFIDNSPAFYKNLNTFRLSKYNEYLCLSDVIITQEMKEQAINYLLENNIPIDTKTYIAVLRRMVNQEKEKNKLR